MGNSEWRVEESKVWRRGKEVTIFYLVLKPVKPFDWAEPPPLPPPDHTSYYEVETWEKTQLRNLLVRRGWFTPKQKKDLVHIAATTMLGSYDSWQPLYDVS